MSSEQLNVEEGTAREERRERTTNQVRHLIEERQELLALFAQASGVAPGNPPGPDLDLIAEFCQVLVDYIAAGHFGLYHRIADGTERRRLVADLAAQVFPRISETTQDALAFSEKYSGKQDRVDLATFQRNLSRLGEILSTRFELEDRLIEQFLDGAGAGKLRRR